MERFEGIAPKSALLSIPSVFTEHLLCALRRESSSAVPALRNLLVSWSAEARNGVQQAGPARAVSRHVKPAPDGCRREAVRLGLWRGRNG